MFGLCLKSNNWIRDGVWSQSLEADSAFLSLDVLWGAAIWIWSVAAAELGARNMDLGPGRCIEPTEDLSLFCRDESNFAITFLASHLI